MYVSPSPKERVLEAVVKAVEDPRRLSRWDLGSHHDSLLFTYAGTRYRAYLDGMVSMRCDGLADRPDAAMTAAVRAELRGIPVPDYGYTSHDLRGAALRV